MTSFGGRQLKIGIKQDLSEIIGFMGRFEENNCNLLVLWDLWVLWVLWVLLVWWAPWMRRCVYINDN